ncbi:MAG: transcriptional repressor LexA [Acidobacteria bacterium]|nr:transcriptional repressor LexA [Acidobacteriota bacterium]
MALTPRQKDVLDFVAGFVNDRGYCPSYEEIAQGLELASLATVHKHISALESKEYLKRSFNHSRSIELAPRYFRETGPSQGRAPVWEIPLEGRIAAGSPVETYGAGETVTIPGFSDGSGTYALEVRGESMIEDHICDGDFVLIERTSQVRNGDVVVAMVRGSETTLKRFYRESDGTVRLQPANAGMAPIRVPEADVEVQGKLLAVLRKYR